MSDIYVDYHKGKVTIFARDTRYIATAKGFEVRPWEEMYTPECWLRCGVVAGFGCYMVHSKGDVEKLVKDHYDTPHTTAIEHAEHAANVLRRAALFGLNFGDNWEPIFADWEAEFKSNEQGETVLCRV